MNEEMDVLSTKHKEQLWRESGISEEAAKKAGVFSVDEALGKALIGGGGAGIAFPYFDIDTNLLGYRVKQDNPTKDKRGKISGKYLTSKKSDAAIYFVRDDLDKIKSSRELIIVEGEKKLLKFLQETSQLDAASVALAGCWMFRKSDMEFDELHPVLDSVLENKSKVTIIPDGDYFENPKVKAAYNRLAKIIFTRGVEVSLVDVRIKGIAKKIGVDDFLMEKGKDELLAKINEPFVTFENLSEKALMDIIDKDGITEKTFGKIFASMAFLDRFQISEKIRFIRHRYHLKSKDLEAYFNRSKFNFSSLMKEDSPDNYIKHNPKEEGQDVLLTKVGKELSSMPGAFLFGASPKKLLMASEDFSEIKIADSKTELFDLLGNLIVVLEIRTTDQGEIPVSAEPLNKDYTSILFSHLPRFVQSPSVEIVSQTPTFDMKKNETIYIKGYYSEQKLILTDSFAPKQTDHSTIENLLNNIPFRTPADKENFLGMLITAVILKHSLPGAFPSLLVRAQEHGSGKTKLAECLQYLIEGRLPGRIAYKTDVELEKHIAAQIQDSSSLLIDNIRLENLNSVILEKLITEPQIAIRKLGTNTEIKKINNVLVMMTMNGGAMTSDLASRCVVIELDKSLHKNSFGFDPLQYAEKFRKDIIEEVLGMVLKTDFSKSIQATDTRFPLWEGLTKKILFSNGYTQFLSNAFEMYESIDENLSKIFNSILQYPDSFKGRKKPNEISDLLRNLRKQNESSELSPAKVGLLLSKKAGKPINFMGFDKLRYEFIIRKLKSSTGGDNHEYLFDYKLQESVGTVALSAVPSQEQSTSACNLKSISERPISEIPHEPTFFEMPLRVCSKASS